MILSEKEYLEKTYAGFLGMNIGIRLGAPVEPSIWTSERIEKFYKDITDYVKPFKNFAADDDVNGPVYFLRALEDKIDSSSLTPNDVASAWLNYAREGVGMFWWGGYGVSTEHTAYLNLKNGIKAPASGSEAVNGLLRSEQIGGQIFIDTWGFISPGKTDQAVNLATVAASVSHDKNGLYGAAFIAACIAKAYVCQNIDEIIEDCLDYIPQDCTYAKVVKGVQEFYLKNSNSWRDCLKYLQENWGYDRYGGICHIIPNAGVCIMALLYGRNFARSIEIATMAGWDTDCNAGNVGSIMGVMDGLKGIPEHYRKPLKDSVVLSGISGYLNVVDIPSYVHKLYDLALKLEGVKSNTAPNDGELHFTFDLPGSTHCLRVSNENLGTLTHVDDVCYNKHGSLRIGYARMARGQSFKVFYKSLYRRSDFDDERYSPIFSPTVNPGQKVDITYKVEKFNGETVCISPYIHSSFSNKDIVLNGKIIKSMEDWETISFIVPALEGEYCEEVGLLFESNSPSKFYDYGSLFIGEFNVSGKAKYTVDFSKQKKEFGSILGFSHNHGAWELVDGWAEVMGLNHAEAMSGNYFTKNAKLSFVGQVNYGKSLLASLRVQGAMRGYYAGFYDDKLIIGKTVEGKLQILNAIDYPLILDKEYEFIFTASNDTLTLSLGSIKLEVEDDSYKYGMLGFGIYQTGRAKIKNMRVEEL